MKYSPLAFISSRFRADSGAGRDHEEREVVALAIWPGKDVIAQAKTIRPRLPAEVKGMNRVRCAGREKMNGIAVALGLEELPDRLYLHELGGFGFSSSTMLYSSRALAFALREVLLEVAFIPEMPAEEHERIDVAPELGQLRHIAHFAVEIRDAAESGDRCEPCGCALRTTGPASLRRRLRRTALAGMLRLAASSRFAFGRIHDLIHEAQAGHGVFGVADRLHRMPGAILLR